jgi:hypothetical protein
MKMASNFSPASVTKSEVGVRKIALILAKDKAVAGGDDDDCSRNGHGAGHDQGRRLAAASHIQRAERSQNEKPSCDGAAPMRLFAVALIPTLLAACVQEPPPARSGPQQIGWKKLDGSAAEVPVLEQAIAICNEEAARAADPATAPLMQAMAKDATLKSCMAQKGYLPLMGKRG